MTHSGGSPLSLIKGQRPYGKSYGGHRKAKSHQCYEKKGGNHIVISGKESAKRPDARIVVKM